MLRYGGYVTLPPLSIILPIRSEAAWRWYSTVWARAPCSRLCAAIICVNRASPSWLRDQRILTCALVLDTQADAPPCLSDPRRTVYGVMLWKTFFIALRNSSLVVYRLVATIPLMLPTRNCPEWYGQDYVVAMLVVHGVWNVMAHTQKQDFVFRRKGRVHLNRPGGGGQFIRLLAAEVSGSNAGYTIFRGSVKSTVMGEGVVGLTSTTTWFG
jgi:hypothetical protein